MSKRQRFLGIDKFQVRRETTTLPHTNVTEQEQECKRRTEYRLLNPFWQCDLYKF